MIKVSYCCHEEMSCSCKIGEYTFISHTPYDIVITPNDCEVKNDIKVDVDCFKRIYGCVMGKCGAPIKNLLVKLFKECWKYGSKVFEEVSIAMTDSCGLYEFIVPGTCKNENYKVVISNASLEDCSRKIEKCSCKDYKSSCHEDSTKCSCNHREASSCKQKENNFCRCNEEKPCNSYDSNTCKCSSSYKPCKSEGCSCPTSKFCKCPNDSNYDDKSSSVLHNYAKDTMISSYKYYNRTYYNS